jgi:hypothetical protein
MAKNKPTKRFDDYFKSLLDTYGHTCQTPTPTEMRELEKNLVECMKDIFNLEDSAFPDDLKD